LNKNTSESSKSLLEKRVEGREFSVGLLNGQALEVVEISLPEGRMYDYEQKYFRDDTIYTCPAELNVETEKSMKAAAERAYQLCLVRDYCRVDFVMDRQGRWYLLEINTLPGMTLHSLLPKSASASGIDFRTLLEKMLSGAIERFRNLTDHG
jgi:D-alanine-D-alanine ligase